MYDNKENNFKKKGLCISLCAALVCGLGIGGVYYKTNKAPQNDGTKLFSDSTINKIIEMVENASNKKAESEKFITKFASYYTPIVVISAVVVGILFPLVFGNFNLWFGRALIFLVISCPCALVISVPLTFFSSIGTASKQGILIKGGNYLETLTNIGAVVFDKTGTLTQSRL